MLLVCSALTLLTPLGLLLIQLAKAHPAFIERYYSTRWYRGVATVLTAITGRAAFSFMEVVLILLGVGLLVYLGFWIVELLRRPHDWWKILLRRVWILASACSAVFFYFILCGDLNYYRFSVGVPLGYSVEETDAATLRSLCELLARQANWFRAGRGEDNERVFAAGADFRVQAVEASDDVAALDSRYGVSLFSLAERAHPKAMAFSQVMSSIQLTGVIFPYLAEANINTDQPAFGIPSTMCHELSHICGYMREDEANFIAYLACLEGSGDFCYSGSMLALIHATNALSAADPTAYSEVMAGLTPAVRRDLEANSRYWDTYDTTTGRAATQVNDAYLKANDQSDGVQSYGRMVDLLIACYRARGVL